MIKLVSLYVTLLKVPEPTDDMKCGLAVVHRTFSNLLPGPNQPCGVPGIPLGT